MTFVPETEPDHILPVVRYASADEPRNDRYAAWREGSPLSFGQLFDTTPAEPFAVETVATELGTIGFSHSRMTGQRWERTHAHVRTDGMDPLMVAIRFAGNGHGDCNGRAFEAPPGSIVLSDFAQPQAYVSDTAFTAVLAIPRQIAERTLPRVRTLHGLVVQPKAALLLRAHAAAMVEALQSGLDARHAERLGRVALDLLEIGVAQSMSSDPVSREAMGTGARLAVEAIVEAKLGSATLTIANLCKWSGQSRSTLYRLFDADGGVQAYIRARRLSRVADELRKGGEDRLADLADHLGFSDASHLSRLFRAQFGQSPSEFRMAHLPGRAR